MNSSKTQSQALVMLEDVLGYIEEASGLHYSVQDSGIVEVAQSLDNRRMTFPYADILEVLDRQDSDGQQFIQVNFSQGKKVLFTDALIGFKPVQIVGLDITKLPKVVTTPDLLSVLEALNDGLSEEGTAEGYETELLKKVFRSILEGGLQIGFDLKREQEWLHRILATRTLGAA